MKIALIVGQFDRSAKGLLALFVANYAIGVLKWLLFQPDGSGVFWIVDVSTHVLFPLIFLWILAKYFSLSPHIYGLGSYPPDKRRLSLWLAVPTYTSLLGAAIFVGYVIGLIVVATDRGGAPLSPLPYSWVVPTTGAARVIMVFYFAISASIFEEIFFRGIFQRLCDVLAPNARRAAVVGVSGLIFASTHWAGGAVAIASSLLFGFVAAYLFSYQRDLKPLILSHFLLDTFIGFQ